MSECQWVLGVNAKSEYHFVGSGNHQRRFCAIGSSCRNNYQQGAGRERAERARGPKALVADCSRNESRQPAWNKIGTRGEIGARAAKRRKREREWVRAPTSRRRRFSSPAISLSPANALNAISREPGEIIKMRCATTSCVHRRARGRKRASFNVCISISSLFPAHSADVRKKRSATKVRNFAVTLWN